MEQQTGVQVDITRFAKVGAKSSCNRVGPQLPQGPRKQHRAPASLFALLSKPTATQPPAKHQEAPEPPNKKPHNALSTIFRRRRHATGKLIVADGNLQQGSLAQQLPSSSKASAGHEQQQRQAGHPTCSMSTQLSAAPNATLLGQTPGFDLAQNWSPQTRGNSATVGSQPQPLQQQQAGHHQQQASLQECPLCGEQLPAGQLQQHVDQELQDLEDLESTHQPLTQPQQQPSYMQTHLQLQQEQQTYLNHSLQQHPAATWQLPTEHHLIQHVAKPQQRPLKPLQLPRLQTQSRQPHHFALQQQAYQQQDLQADLPGQSGNTAGCGEHVSLQFPWQQSRGQQQLLQQPPRQRQWYSAPPQQRHSSQEQRMCQTYVPDQPVPSALHQQQQQSSASKPLQLPKLKFTQKQDRHQRQRSRKRSRGHSSSSVLSSVTTLNMAPARAIDDLPKSVVLDTFDHWGDSTINWLDDSMIGLEGAPQSAGECWEGIGRCAAGPRTLR